MEEKGRKKKEEEREEEKERGSRRRREEGEQPINKNCVRCGEQEPRTEQHNEEALGESLGEENG